MTIREDLVSSAQTFLSDPKVQASPLTKRLSFLESKGLTQEEITEVLNRLNNSSLPSVAPPVPQYSSYGNPYGQNPELPRRDWRDWFIMAVVSSGVSYGLYTLAKRYVVPLIKPPTPAELENDKALVTAKFDEAQRTLDLLKAEAAELKSSQEKQQQKVGEALESVEKAVRDLRESGSRRESDLRGFKTDIDSIRELIPKALERNKEAQTNQLQDLQNELKSLKSLLLNRQRPFTPTGVQGASSAPPMNANLSVTNGTSPNVQELLNAAHLGPSETPPAGSADVSPYLPSKPGIPAWQLAARNKAQQAPESADESLQT